MFRLTHQQFLWVTSRSKTWTLSAARAHSHKEMFDNQFHLESPDPVEEKNICKKSEKLRKTNLQRFLRIGSIYLKPVDPISWNKLVTSINHPGPLIIIISSISEVWKIELTIELRNGFEQLFQDRESSA